MLERSSRFVKKFFSAAGRSLLEQIDIADVLGGGIGGIEGVGGILGLLVMAVFCVCLFCFFLDFSKSVTN